MVSTSPALSSLCAVVDALDSSVVVGSLAVSVEGLEAFQSVMEDPDHDYTLVSSLETDMEAVWHVSDPTPGHAL